MDVIQDGDGHKEDRDHGAHDMDRIAGADEQPHGPDYREHGIHPHREEKGCLTEKQEDQDHDHHEGKRRHHRHLDEHFTAEGIFRNR